MVACSHWGKNMLRKWRAFVKQVACAPGMVTGVRKVAFDQSFELTWKELTSCPIKYEDISYTKMKGRQLERIYWPKEPMEAALEKLRTRLAKPHSSVAVQLSAGVKDSRSQGFCMQNLVITQTADQMYIDIYYRSTEVVQKFLADLIFFAAKLPPLFPDRKPSVIRFKFANTYLSAVFAPILLRYEPLPREFFVALYENDPKFFRTFGLATRKFFKDTHNYTYRTRVKMFEYYQEHLKDDVKMKNVVLMLSKLTGDVPDDEEEEDEVS